jgi:hypothetical protein
MSTTSIISFVLVLLAAVIVAGAVYPANAQYGGPPMWDRNYGDYRLPPRYRHPMYRPPPPLPPCIRYGWCAAPPIPRYGYPY